MLDSTLGAMFYIVLFLYASPMKTVFLLNPSTCTKGHRLVLVINLAACSPILKIGNLAGQFKPLSRSILFNSLLFETPIESENAIKDGDSPCEDSHLT